MSESRGRKRKQGSEKDLEQELELLKMKLRKLEEKMTSGTADAGTEGRNHVDQASSARAPDRSSLDEGYTSSGAAAANTPQPPFESDVKRIHEKESHRQLNLQHAPPKHVKDSKVIKSNNSPPSSPEGNKDNISRYKPPSPGPSHSRDVTFNPQPVSMQLQTLYKTESSVTLVNNIQHLSIAQNFLCTPPHLPSNMRFKKLNNIPPSSPESKEGNIVNKRPSSPTNNIHPEMAERLHSVLQNGLPKEERYYLQEKYKIPNNCTLMKAPILNPEVIPFMDEVAKKRDSTMFKYQNQLGAGMVAIAEGVTLVSKSGNGGFKIAMEHIHRGLHLLADLHYDQTRVRRIVCTPINSMLKSFLVEKLSHRHHNFQDINHLFQRDDTIFGRDIGCMIKEFLWK